MAKLIPFTCPACEQSKESCFATSRYLNESICNDCATREAFEGAFWPRAQVAWAETLARVAVLKAWRARGTFEVWGNYGTLTVARDNGEVLAYTPADDTDESEGYGDIVRFDLPSFIGCAEIPESVDILDFGFWTIAGDYEERARTLTYGRE